MNNSYACRGSVQQIMPSQPYNGSGRGHIGVEQVMPPSPYKGSGRISSIEQIMPPSPYNGSGNY